MILKNNRTNCFLEQDLQQEQELEIHQLEVELEQIKFQHEDRIRGLKTAFLKEKRAFEEDMEAKVQAMADEANKVHVTSEVLKNSLFFLCSFACQM